ncbi:hypothetical protein FQN50_009725 [Emmonsiellopsis sp. PD_5]|nr:hypothetical protein FQN50_009725 [Emmonsiellopsis sp. PD_5]
MAANGNAQLGDLSSSAIDAILQLRRDSSDIVDCPALVTLQRKLARIGNSTQDLYTDVCDDVVWTHAILRSMENSIKTLEEHPPSGLPIEDKLTTAKAYVINLRPGVEALVLGLQDKALRFGLTPPHVFMLSLQLVTHGRGA